MRLVLKPSLDFYVTLMPLKIPHLLDAYGLLVTNVLEDWTTPIDLEASPLFPKTFHAFLKSKRHVPMELNMFPKIELHSHSTCGMRILTPSLPLHLPRLFSQALSHDPSNNLNFQCITVHRLWC